MPTPSEAPPHTFGDFMEDSLHHPIWGYYADGRVLFGESSDAADFTTFPVSMRPHFGAMLGERIHQLWHACGAPSDFTILELGAGLGTLAHDLLDHLRAKRPELYSAAHYIIGERSTALRALQLETNACFVAEGRLRVRAVDAQCLADGSLRASLLEERERESRVSKPASPQPASERSGSERSPSEHTSTERGQRRLCGVLLSNELPDAFAVEKLIIEQKTTHSQEAAEGAAERSLLTMRRCHVYPLIRARELREIVREVMSAMPYEMLGDREALLRRGLGSREGEIQSRGLEFGVPSSKN